MDYFTADLHLGHHNILKYTKRPFKNIDEMDEALISNWNELIDSSDTVYVLGDFTLGDIEVFWRYREQLDGKVKIVPGGHDYRWLKKFEPTKWTEVLPPLYTLEYPSNTGWPVAFVLCHYAMRVWDRSHYGTYHLFGHSHGNLKAGFNSIDVGVDPQQYYPVSKSELMEYFSLRSV